MGLQICSIYTPMIWSLSPYIHSLKHNMEPGIKLREIRMVHAWVAGMFCVA